MKIVKPILKEYDHLRVSAIQWTRNNFNEVKEFVYSPRIRKYITLVKEPNDVCGYFKDDIKPDDIYICGTCSFNQHYLLHKSDWFIKFVNKHDYCEVIPNEEFIRDWEEVINV